MGAAGAAPTLAPRGRGTDEPAAGRAAGAAPTVAPLDLGTDEPAARRAAAFLTYALAVVALLAAAIAYADPGPVTLGLLLALVAGTWAAGRTWRRREPVTVTATGSRLEIVRAGSRHVFDLASPDVPVDVVGIPGEPGWRLAIHRRGMAPFELDGARVDAPELMRILTEHRPEVRYRPR